MILFSYVCVRNYYPDAKHGIWCSMNERKFVQEGEAWCILYFRCILIVCCIKYCIYYIYTALIFLKQIIWWPGWSDWTTTLLTHHRILKNYLTTHILCVTVIHLQKVQAIIYFAIGILGTLMVKLLLARWYVYKVNGICIINATIDQ